MNRRIGVILLSALLFLSGCTGGAETEGREKMATQDLFAMDTYMTVTCYGEKSKEALEAAVKEIQRLDRIWTVGSAESEIGGINRTGRGSVSEDTKKILKRSLELYHETGGVFDITVYPLMRLWGFDRTSLGNQEQTPLFHAPKQEEIDRVLPLVNAELVSLEENPPFVSLGKGQGIDLGGIAKGYTSNRIMEIFQQYHLDSGYVSLGGNVQVYGSKPDGSEWNCGIKDPEEPGNPQKFLGQVKVTDKAVITSGAYERYMTDASTGKTFHHILDPKTGYPSDSGIISATIVSRDGMLADALSTTCFIMGLDKAVSFWKTSGEDFEMILMTTDRTVYVTEGIEKEFTSSNEVKVIRK